MGHFWRWRSQVVVATVWANTSAAFCHASVRRGRMLVAATEQLDIEFLLRAVPHIRQAITVRDVLGVYDLAPGTKTFEDIHRGDVRPPEKASYPTIWRVVILLYQAGAGRGPCDATERSRQ